LDGVVAAAVAWRAHDPERRPVRVTLTGYGEVDNALLESLNGGYETVVLDLFCQKQETIDELDRRYEGGMPLLFDHHESTRDRYGNRPWAVVDTSKCAARVYHEWLLERTSTDPLRKRLEALSGIVAVAEDRDLWKLRNPDSRLWSALVTLAGSWGVLMRLNADPSPILSPNERGQAEAFVERQEARFDRARAKALRVGDDLLFCGADLLEFGDVSDFCGLILDRLPNPPFLVAVAARRPAGDWAVSLRSREGLAGRVVALLKDGRKVRGGGHADAAALYWPAGTPEDRIREGLLSAIRAEAERRTSGPTLGDLFTQAMTRSGKP
jgi:hypothetical protein